MIVIPLQVVDYWKKVKDENKTMTKSSKDEGGEVGTKKLSNKPQIYEKRRKWQKRSHFQDLERGAGKVRDLAAHWIS